MCVTGPNLPTKKIGSNKPNWTKLTKLERIDQSALNGSYGPNGPNRTKLTKVKRMDRTGPHKPNWTK